MLVIVGLIAGGALQAWTAQLISSRIASTKTGEQTIKTALISFIERNNRLPCPAVATLLATDANYGREAPTPGTCTGTVAAGTSVKGIVPWLALGLPDEAVSDGYYRRYSYYVTLSQTNLSATTVAGMRGTMTVHSGVPVTLGLAATGNQINSCSTTAGDNSCNLAAVVVLISHGANGLGAYLPNGVAMAAAAAAREIENADANVAFVRSDYSNNPADPFDDILLALSPDDLLGPLGAKGAIASPRATTNEQLRSARDTIVAQIINSAPTRGQVPAALAPPILDGWGIALDYNRIEPNVCTPIGPVTFTITSLGVDGLLGVNPATVVNDDIVITGNTASLKTAILNLGSPCP